MSIQVLLYAIGAVLVIYLAFLLGLFLVDRDRARLVAAFIPDCVVLFRRLVGDPGVSRRHKILLAALVPYLALPFDLVPDFIPVVGHLDDAIVVAFVLRRVARGAGGEIIAEHWPGPESSLALVLRLAGLRGTPNPIREH